MPSKIIGVIPARLGSRRLPGKVLRDIAGKPMLQWVYENARRSPLLTDLIVATEDDEVREFCRSRGMQVMMTGRHGSGSDRVHEVMVRTDADIYLNIQGDEPTVQPVHLELLLSPFERDASVTTLKIAVGDSSARDPNTVKVVTDRRGCALYFSRYPIPFDREGTGVQRFKHLGLYAYTRSALALFHQLPPSPLEAAEKLEQLRYLHNGVPIVVAETEQDTIGVDSEEDLRRAEALLSDRRMGS